jgi:diketogulonate reductase-like aldo/keto reductase
MNINQQIGFGPGGCGYSSNQKPQCVHGRILSALLRRYNKYIVRPQIEKNYVDAISNAIKQGFRWIDYSCAYGDGKLIGEAIKQSGVKREELIITTRVSNYAQFNDCVREEFLNFLKNAQLDYVDILQFHWPVTDYYLDTWREMEKLFEEGYLKHLGVANCHQHHLEEIFKVCKYKPAVGQFEIHPLFTQKPLIEYYKQHDIQVCAYTPIARFDDRLMRLPLLKNIAAKYCKSITQIILRWHIQNGIIPIVRTLNPSHQKENLDVYDFVLTAEEMQLIDGVNINSRLRYDPDNCDFNIL